MIRRLDPENDREIYEQVFAWEKDYPRWLRDAEKACGMSLDEFLVKGQLEKRADVGIFAPELVGMISVNFDRGPKVFEAHIWAKRRTSLDLLAEAGLHVRDSLAKDLGMKAFFVWVVRRNNPIKKLCAMIGCVLDGASVIDGESHGKPIEWQRMIWVRPDLIT